MKKEYLNHAIIELTTECNLRCEHCYNWWKQTGKQHLFFFEKKSSILLQNTKNALHLHPQSSNTGA